MNIDSATGWITWTPDANQVPTTNNVTVRVTDSGAPALSASRSFPVVTQAAEPWRYVTVDWNG